MKQAILELIDSNIEQYPYEDDDTGMNIHSEHNKFRGTLKELRSEIEKMDELDNSKWIPVTERLPDGDEEFIVLTSSGIVMTQFFSTDDDKFEKQGIPGTVGYGNMYGNVTHWQPLPLPPNN